MGEHAALVDLESDREERENSSLRRTMDVKDSLISALRQDLCLQEEKVAAQNKRLAEAQEVIVKLKMEKQRVLKHNEDLEHQLSTAEERLDLIRKDLGERLLCPLSFKPMREPVIGTDLRTYQKDAIEVALENKKASPFTRAPMEKGFLRPNLLATDFLELMAKHFPDWEADTQVQPPAPLPPVDFDLLSAALKRRNSDEAIDLLGRDVDWDVLNGTYTIRSVEMTLLHLTISHRLPQVACAVISRRDFRRMETFSSQGIAAIHMAAAFNFGDVCRAIVGDIGNQATYARTKRAVQLDAPNGRSLLVPQGSTAIDCARLFGHDPDWIDVAES